MTISAPVGLNQRIEVLDTLRGIAVLGILTINIESLSGLTCYPASALPDSPTPWLDRTTLSGAWLLAITKFVSIFSLLFGMGFALQLERARARGASARDFFVRRMGWLFLFGVLHAQLLWSGDILRFYAVLGLVLLAVTGWSNRRLAIVGWTFAAGGTAVVYILNSLLPPPTVTLGLSDQSFKALVLEIYATGSLGEILAMNVIRDLNSLSNSGLITLVSSFGKFLLGFWMVRIGLVQNPEKHPRLLKTLIRYGLLVGIPASVVYVLVRHDIIVLTPALGWLPFVVTTGLLLHAFLYVALVLKYRHLVPMRWLATLLTPVGRMALTNYIAQTLICVLLFYNVIPGMGLFGRLGYASLALVCAAIFVVQILWSRLWLSVFPFGPLEWLWRRLSYAQWTATDVARGGHRVESA